MKKALHPRISIGPRHQIERLVNDLYGLSATKSKSWKMQPEEVWRADEAEMDVLKRLEAETAAKLDALLPVILDRVFKGEP